MKNEEVNLILSITKVLMRRRPIFRSDIIINNGDGPDTAELSAKGILSGQRQN